MSGRFSNSMTAKPDTYAFPNVRDVQRQRMRALEAVRSMGAGSQATWRMLGSWRSDARGRPRSGAAATQGAPRGDSLSCRCEPMVASGLVTSEDVERAIDLCGDPRFRFLACAAKSRWPRRGLERPLQHGRS